MKRLLLVLVPGLTLRVGAQLPTTNAANTIVHEFTHDCVAHLPLPLG